VNNASIMSERPTRRVPLKDYPIEWWDKIMKVNIGGVLICTQACVPSMIERGGGKIVNQSSSAAYSLHSEAYAVSKLGVIGLTLVLARELGPYNINVNAIAPGAITTDAMRSVGVVFDEADEQQKIGDGVVAIQSFGPPADLCGSLLLLCSPAGKFITGHTLRVDGGRHMTI
jgi:NAD(P)-dependent dehydrogenase (short-subunit alcohol dehydrogenase family)